MTNQVRLSWDPYPRRDGDHDWQWIEWGTKSNGWYLHRRVWGHVRSSVSFKADSTYLEYEFKVEGRSTVVARPWKEVPA